MYFTRRKLTENNALEADETCTNEQWRSQKCELGGLAFLPSPLPFLSLSPLSPPYPFLSPFLLLPPPFRSRTRKIQLGSLGSAVSSPAGSGAEAQPKSNLVHCSFKIWALMVTILIIFWVITDRPYWHVQCSFNVWLCIVWGICPPLATPVGMEMLPKNIRADAWNCGLAWVLHILRRLLRPPTNRQINILFGWIATMYVTQRPTYDVNSHLTYKSSRLNYTKQAHAYLAYGLSTKASKTGKMEADVVG